MHKKSELCGEHKNVGSKAAQWTGTSVLTCV